jgi:hypothetical protein
MFPGVRKTRCCKVREMFSEYIDNRLDAGDRDAVERHLKTCKACANELESLRITVQLLRRIPSVTAPRSFAIREAEAGRSEVTTPRSPGWLRPVPAFAVSWVGAGWSSLCDPQRLRWLRPATAFATAALVLLLVLDFLQVVPQQGGIDNREVFNGSAAQVMLSPAPEEGEVTLEAPPAPVPPEPTLKAPTGLADSDELVVGDDYGGGEEITAETTGGWPLRQIEIAVGAVLFILAAVTVIAWRRRRWWGEA